ncbi:pro-resilin-like [Panulirus ornatus]|uniref:pro-resilin-like n=1 Tax=Panulirus ornatus TaxID=150431 RepID=UPI003A84E980
MKAAFLVLTVAVAAWAVPEGYGNQGSGGHGGQGGQGGQGSFAPAQYNFQWEVNDPPSANFYGHQEQRDGANTQGSYYVQLPDSRRLLVDYTADASGYRPVVTYEGEAQFPSGSGQSGSGQGQSYSGQGQSYA